MERARAYQTARFKLSLRLRALLFIQENTEIAEVMMASCRCGDRRTS
jgi:hypothetical protein